MCMMRRLWNVCFILQLRKVYGISTDYKTMRDHVVTTQSELGETWHDQLRQNAWGDLKQASVILKGWISKLDKSRSTSLVPSFTQSPPNIGQKVLQNLHLGETHCCHQPAKCCNSAMLQVHVKHAELSGIHLDPESVQENDYDNRHTFSEHQGSICHLPYCGSSAAT